MTLSVERWRESPKVWVVNREDRLVVVEGVLFSTTESTHGDHKIYLGPEHGYNNLQNRAWELHHTPPPGYGETRGEIPEDLREILSKFREFIEREPHATVED